MVGRRRFRRFRDDVLRQQKLPKYQFSSTPKCMLVFVFILGFFCIATGFAFTMASRSIKEDFHEYTNTSKGEISTFSINLTEYQGDIFIYYQVEGLSQLSRTMRNSYDADHFSGDYSYICTGENWGHRAIFRPLINRIFGNESILSILGVHRFLNGQIPASRSEDNTTYAWTYNFADWIFKNIFSNIWNITYERVLIPEDEYHNAPVPCGERARLFFTDEIVMSDANGQVVNLSSTGIAWNKKMFSNPVDFTQDRACDFFHDNYTGERYDMPENWTKHICEMEGAMENEEFQVWMRPAYAPTFRKLWRKIVRGNSNFTAENCTITITSNWVAPYNEEYGKFMFNKTIVVSTTNWAGGGGNFLGRAYLIVGLVYLMIACAKVVRDARRSNQPYDEEEIRWRKNS